MSWQPMSFEKLYCSCCHKKQSETQEAFTTLRAYGITFLRCPECQKHSLAGIMQTQQILKSIKNVKTNWSKINARKKG